MPLIKIHRLIKQQRRWVSFAGFIFRVLLAVAMIAGGLWLFVGRMIPPAGDASLPSAFWGSSASPR